MKLIARCARNEIEYPESKQYKRLKEIAPNITAAERLFRAEVEQAKNKKEKNNK
jgi:hypothetical protein